MAAPEVPKRLRMRTALDHVEVDLPPDLRIAAMIYWSICIMGSIGGVIGGASDGGGLAALGAGLLATAVLVLVFAVVGKLLAGLVRTLRHQPVLALPGLVALGGFIVALTVLGFGVAAAGALMVSLLFYGTILMLLARNAPTLRLDRNNVSVRRRKVAWSLPLELASRVERQPSWLSDVHIGGQAVRGLGGLSGQELDWLRTLIETHAEARRDAVRAAGEDPDQPAEVPEALRAQLERNPS